MGHVRILVMCDYLQKITLCKYALTILIMKRNINNNITIYLFIIYIQLASPSNNALEGNTILYYLSSRSMFNDIKT